MHSCDNQICKLLNPCQIHSCDNQICKLLNPCLTDLLKYQDLRNKATEVEELFFNMIKDPSTLSKLSLPLDLWSWCDQHMIYQLPNLEFVQELAKTIKEINPETILEIAAGRGVISRHISKILDKDIILTDDYSWWEKEESDKRIGYPGIIKMDYKDAIKKYKPDLIIASWIPYHKYWTKDFRECPSIKGYILIGEGPGGCTGNENDWKTKWIKHDLDDVEKYGICRTDHGFSSGRFTTCHTRVTYFKRPKR